MDVGGLIREAREEAELTQSALAQLAGTSQSALCAYERGDKTPSLLVLERVLAATGKQLVVGIEPLWADIDRDIDALASEPLEARVEELPFHLVGIEGYIEGVPHVVEGSTAALLQGAPIPARTLDIVVPDEEAVLERLTNALYGRSRRLDVAHQALGNWPVGPVFFREHDPSVWLTALGPLRVRLGDLPECVTLIIQDRPVAVVPLVGIEAGDPDVRRVLERMRSRWPTSAG